MSISTRVNLTATPLDSQDLQDLRSGRLNQNPLPFETTLKVLRKAEALNQRAELEPRKEALYRLIRNLNAKDIKQIEIVDASENHYIDEVASALLCADWKNEIFNNERFGQYVFAAFKEGKISIEQLTTVFLQWEAKQQFAHDEITLNQHAVFDGDGLGQNIRLLMTALWKMSDTQMNTFFHLLRKSPASEQFFWTVEIPTDRKGRLNIGLPYARFLEKFQEIFKLFRPQGHLLSGVKRLVIPSFSIMKSYLKALFGTDAVTMVPEFGIATSSQFEIDIPRNRHTFAIHFPKVSGLEAGDGHYFGKYLSSLHDFYHSHRASLIPFERRLAYLRVAHLFKHSQKISELYPQDPLLTVLWSTKTVVWEQSSGKVFKYSKISPEMWTVYYEQIINLEVPATDGYLQSFRVQQEESIAQSVYVPFQPFKYKYAMIDGEHPEDYFCVAMILHDMVTHAREWKLHFDLDGYNSCRWSEDCVSVKQIQEHLIYGFQLGLKAKL